MAGHRIEWTKLSLQRILEIAEFRFPDNEKRTQEWMGSILERAERLVEFPYLGAQLSPEGQQNVRRFLFDDVWIVYEVLEDHVLVLTVRHVRGNPDKDFD